MPSGSPSPNLLAVTVAIAIVIPLGWQLTGGAASPSAQPLTIAAILVGGGTLFVAVGGILNISGSLSWFVPAREPDRAQRRTAMRIAVRQSATLTAAWAASGIVFILTNLDRGTAVAVPTVLGVIRAAPRRGLQPFCLPRARFDPS